MSDAATILFGRNDDGFDDWITAGVRLGDRERDSQSLMWDIGDWWNRGEPFGQRVKIVNAPDWKGPTHRTAQETSYVCRKFPPSIRIEGLTFKHHQVVAALEDDTSIPLLEAAANQGLSTSELRTLVKQTRRAEREAELAAKIAEISSNIGHRLYGVIYADPPWRFEPYSRDTGMDRAADNHYPTMDIAAICALPVPAADDCALFLWATVPMLPEALEVMKVWGFTYKSHFIWAKDTAGTGYWNRNQHELLLVGTRGDVPAPAPGEQFSSIIHAPTSAHSSKPMAFAEMIEEMFPNASLLEMFAREQRTGWDLWGAEAPINKEETDAI